MYIFRLTFLGLVTGKAGNLDFHYFSKEMAYSVAIYCVISVPVLLVLRLRFVQHGLVDGNFDKEVLVYVMALLMMPHLGIPLTHWYEMRFFQFIFKRWKQFQILYEETFGNKLSLKPHWTTKLLLCVLMTATTIAMSINAVMFGFKSCWETFAHVHVLHLYFLHNFILIGLCCQLRVIARDVRLRLIQAVKVEDVGMIVRICSFWICLSEITRLVGSLFYRMYCYLFMALFSISTVVLYAVLRAAAHHQLNIYMLGEFILIWSNGAWIFFACEFGERVANDIGNKFTLSLSKLRSGAKSSEVKYEIDSFISMITSYPPYITLNEYIVINRKLFVSINGTMVTYLIVVLQFAQDYSDEDVFLPANITGFV